MFVTAFAEVDEYEGWREGGEEYREERRKERRKEERRECSRKFIVLSVANIHHMHNTGASKFEGYNIQNEHHKGCKSHDLQPIRFLNQGNVSYLPVQQGKASSPLHRQQMYGQASLLPRPSPSFPSLAVQLSKRQEAGQGPGNEATVKLQALEVSTIHSF